MRLKVRNCLFEGGNGVTEMMETSASPDGARKFTLGSVRLDQFKVGPLSGQLQKLHRSGLQGIVDHGRRDTVIKAEAIIFGCRLDGLYSVTDVMEPHIQQRTSSIAHPAGTPRFFSRAGRGKVCAENATARLIREPQQQGKCPRRIA